MFQKIDWRKLQENDFYQVGKNGVRELVTSSDPSDPFPLSVFGGVGIEKYLNDLEQYACDPSFDGQIPVAPRDHLALPAWSVRDSSSRSLVVHEGPGENIVSDAIDRRVRHEEVLEPRPIVPTPVLNKYVEMIEVEISESSAQAAGVRSDKSVSETGPAKKVFKVSCSFSFI